MKRSKEEKAIEKYLEEKVVEKGGLCPKFVSPGMNGMPDRLVMMPDGILVFVELKREKGGVISPMQKWRKKCIEERGQKVYFINSYSQVDHLVASLRKGIIPDVI